MQSGNCVHHYVSRGALARMQHERAGSGRVRRVRIERERVSNVEGRGLLRCTSLSVWIGKPSRGRAIVLRVPRPRRDCQVINSRGKAAQAEVSWSSVCTWLTEEVLCCPSTILFSYRCTVAF